MKARPILMNGEMVRATLSDLKTQTRRIVKPQPQTDGGSGRHPVRPFQMPDGRWRWVLAATGVGVGEPFECPMGVTGDRLYVRETWARSRNNWLYAASCAGLSPRECVEEWDWSSGMRDRWSPSIHMPKRASRITLEITDVRIERVQCITNADALAEGCVAGERASESDAFHNLWDSIYGPESWAANPWVFAVTFRRIEATHG